MLRRTPIVIVVLAAGCGGGDPAPAPTSTPAQQRAQPPPLPGPPDAGTRAGHGAGPDAGLFDLRPPRRRVPAHDATPPLAVIRVEHGGGPPILRASRGQGAAPEPIALARPSLVATALARDEDGGIGRIRVSAEYVTDCGGRRRQHGAYFPAAQIENVRLAPGARAPIQRTRRATLRFPPGCSVRGEVDAEATNAHGLESVSAPVRFAWGGPP